jgi:hypothetical protein
MSQSENSFVKLFLVPPEQWKGKVYQKTLFKQNKNIHKENKTSE